MKIEEYKSVNPELTDQMFVVNNSVPGGVLEPKRRLTSKQLAEEIVKFFHKNGNFG